MRKRLCSAFLALIMALGLLPASAFAAPGDGDTRATTTPATVTGGINGYVAQLTADGVTSGTHTTAFDVNENDPGAVPIKGTNEYRSTALNGKVWADKSVAVNTTNPKLFDVTLSALGQTFSTREVTEKRVAFDVMFVMDLSASMTASRFQAAVSAMNSAMNELRDGTDAKKNNRFGIAVFGDSGRIVLDLGKYDKKSGESDFISYSGGRAPSFKIDGVDGKEETTVSRETYTYTQKGIAVAATHLMQNVKTNDQVVHIPVVILLTDGEPTKFDFNYQNPGTGTVDFKRVSGQVEGTPEKSGQYTVRTAEYYKSELRRVYAAEHGSTAVPKFYTVGQGISENNHYAVAVLNPTQDKLSNGNSRVVELKESLFSNDSVTDKYAYANKAYFSSVDDLDEIFENIMQDIGDPTAGTSVGETTGGRDKMTFFETLGDQVRLDSGFELKVPTYETNATSGNLEAGDSRTYVLMPHTREENGDYKPIDVNDEETDIPAMVAHGEIIYLRPTSVKVGDATSGSNLVSGNTWDSAALNDLQVTVRQLNNGKRQLQVAIPHKLMAYNVLDTVTTNGVSTHTYFESAPVQFKYSAALMDTAKAGEYLIGEASQCYLSFFPSSDKLKDTDQYAMPYYWNWGEDAPATGDTVGKPEKTVEDKKVVDKVKDSNDYVSTTSWNQGNNHEVSIYLGNNGLYDLDAKEMTVTVNWKDNSNQEGRRFENLPVKLFVDLTGGDFGNGENLQEVDDSAYTLTVADTKTNDDGTQKDDNVWTYTFSDLPAYVGTSASIAKYYMVFTKKVPEAERRGYSVSIDKDASEDAQWCNKYENPTAEDKIIIDTYFLFDGYRNANDALKGNLVLDFTKSMETTTYTLEKHWNGDAASAIQVQLLVDGKAYSNPVTMTATGHDTDNDGVWTHTWTGLPKYRNGGQLVPYRAVEVAVLDAQDATITDQYQTKYVYDDGNDTTDTDLYTKTTVTNTEGSTKMNLMARIIWEDAENNDGVRPEKVYLKLIPKVKGVELTDGNDDLYTELFGTVEMQHTVDATVESGSAWVTSWEDLPRYTAEQDGDQITYTVQQVDENGAVLEQYSSTVGDRTGTYSVSEPTPYGDGYVAVTNTHTPDVVSITVNKTWQDNSDQDGIRPTDNKITGTLYRQIGDGTIDPLSTFVTKKTGEANSNTSGVTIPDQQKYQKADPTEAKGAKVTYYVSEDSVLPYVAPTADITASDGQKVYPVVEDENGNFKVDLANAHTPYTVTYKVILNWVDYGNKDNSRPDKVTIQVGGKSREVTVDKNNLTQTEEIVLPMYQNGVLQNYSGTISDVPKYSENIVSFDSDEITYNLTYNPDPITLSLTKTWTGEGDSEDTRPTVADYPSYLTLERKIGSNGDSETVYVSGKPATGTADNIYTVTWTGLPKYPATGDTPYTYTVTERKVPNYEATTPSNVFELNQGTEIYEAQLTNTYNQQLYDGTITVIKKWSDTDGSEKRPELEGIEDNVFTITEETPDPLNIQLYKTDRSSKVGIPASTITVTDENTWTYTWNANTVPEVDVNGSRIRYTAYENEIPEGYVGYVKPGETDPNPEAGYRFSDIEVVNGVWQGRTDIINTLDDSAVTTGSLTIQKAWTGGKGTASDHQYPSDAFFRIEGDNHSSYAINVTGVTESGGTVGAADLNATLNVQDNVWTINISGLQISEKGKQIKYTVTESVVPDGYTVKHDNNEDLIPVTGATDIPVAKVTNTYNPQPTVLTYNLNGGQGTTPAPVVVDAGDTDKDVKVAEYKDFNCPGAIFLGWAEESKPLITKDNYQTQLQELTLYKADSTNNEINVSNSKVLYAIWAENKNNNDTPDYKETSVTVTLVWDDKGNQDGLRPSEVEVTLTGSDGSSDKKTLDLTVEGGVVMGKTDEGEESKTTWSYTWDGLPTDADGTPITYTVNETQFTVNCGDHGDGTSCEQYKIEPDAEKPYTIINSRDPETVTYSVKKEWDHSEIEDETQYPTDLTATVQLFGNGEPIRDPESLTLDTLEASWSNLPKYQQGEKVTYHVVETNVTGDLAANYNASYSWEDPNDTNEKTVITNTYAETRSVTLIYEWDDNGDAADLRPNSLTIELYDTKDNEDNTVGTQVIQEKNGIWACTWDGLVPDGIYKARVVAIDGEELGESVDATADQLNAHYDFEENEITGNNSVLHMRSALDGEITLKVEKAWVDNNDQFKLRPSSIVVNVYRDGKAYSFLELTKDASWTGELANLPLYQDGKKGVQSVYEVEEMNVPAGYTGTEMISTTENTTSATITNTLDGLTEPDKGVKVTYVFNAPGQENQTEKVVLNGTAKKMQPKEWAGHVFKDWYTDPSFVETSKYDFATPVTQDITLYAKWVSDHGGGGDQDDHHFLTFIYQNASATKEDGTTAIEAGAEHKMKVTCKDDFTFKAFADSGYILSSVSHDGTGIDMVVNGNAYTLKSITKDITVTIKATKQNSGGGGGGGGGGTVNPPKLETGDHFAYVMGYPDEMVKPYNNITRAEVATIFFRLLTDEYREECYSTTNSFTDVSEGMWFNNAISTLSNAEIINGYQDGSFQPNKSITRAELAAIAARFDELTEGEARFTDISGHWAEELIESAYNKGWVGGYPDGTFRPDQAITRAEVMTLINRVLNRHVDQDGMLDDMITWPDNTPEMWFYEAVQEATNSHDYKRDKDETLETWTKINPPRDWSDLEN